MKIRLPILFAVLAAAGIAFLVWWIFFSSSDKELILKNLFEIQALLSKTEGQKLLSGLEEMSRVKRHLAAEVLLRAPEFGYEEHLDPARPLREFSIWRKNCSSVRIAFTNLQIRFPENSKDTAEATFHADVENTFCSSSRRRTFQIRTVLKKDARKWKIVEVSLEKDRK